ncbi:MAG TPA: substrate-binding domain-containing protein [Gemmataceae bacterium]|nr:substrate-binding domain-containing protein [Gemmataceae bacterium]
MKIAPAVPCLRLFTIAACLLTIGCSAKEATTLTLATTTSTQDSGLLDRLVPLFRAQTGMEVKVVAVGTGQALQLGRRGDADVLLVHDPVAEAKFMAEGFGMERQNVMANDFVLVGPPANPAGINRKTAIADAFTRIARSGSPFVSRGDASGTHEKEKEIWRTAGIEPKGDWYLRAGAGMGQVLRMANERRAYTLTDRGTFLALGKGLELAILSEGDSLLVNRYSVIMVSPEKHPHVHVHAARRFAAFLLAPETQKAIAEFGTDRYGQPLFFRHGSATESTGPK